jgi:hypothetical protein
MCQNGGMAYMQMVDAIMQVQASLWGQPIKMMQKNNANQIPQCVLHAAQCSTPRNVELVHHPQDKPEQCWGKLACMNNAS